MALTNTERQRRHREARKAAVIENARLTAEIEKNARNVEGAMAVLKFAGAAKLKLSYLEAHWWIRFGKWLGVLKEPPPPEKPQSSATASSGR